jgi:hypothetical protein
MLKNLHAVSLLLIALGGCGEDEWDGHVYPDKSNLLKSEYLGRYPNLAECRAAALAKISLLPIPARADYECDLNCKPHSTGLSVCEKTLR